MRTIKFRGQRKDTKEWVFGWLVGNKRPLIIGAHLLIDSFTSRGKTISPKASDIYEVIPETVGQFSGLYDSTKWEQLSPEERQSFYDKNRSEDGVSIEYQNVDDVKHLWKGKEIYEGDTLFLCPGMSSTVIFQEGSFMSDYKHWEDPETLYLADAIGEQTIVWDESQWPTQKELDDL